jgi:hypothetical protein
VIVLALWCAVLPTMLDGEHGLSVDGGWILNANLFFSSWGAFIMAMMLGTSHFQKLFGRADDKNLWHWVGFMTAGFIAMASASRIWKDDCESMDDNETCKCTLFAVILGVISGISGLILVLVPIKMVGQVWSFFLLAAWCFAAGYVTFEQGPGTMMGTLYFSTWASVFFSLNVAATSVHEFIGTGTDTTEEVDAAETPETDAAETPEVGKTAEVNAKGAEGEDEEIEEVKEGMAS